MEKHSSNGFWKFLAILFGTLLAGAIGFYVYKQKNPEYDPWEEPWENSSSPINLDRGKHADDSDKDEASSDDKESAVNVD